VVSYTLRTTGIAVAALLQRERYLAVRATHLAVSTALITARARSSLQLYGFHQCKHAIGYLEQQTRGLVRGFCLIRSSDLFPSSDMGIFG
jgi:hypothetical protein